MFERDPWLYVEDMIKFTDRALAYTGGLDQATFKLDSMRHDAVLRNLELMDEAAAHVPANLRDCAPEIPWRQIVATRNRLIHGYLGIDNDPIWSIVTDDLPVTRQGLVKLLASMQQAPR